jgi:hypothetical protein
MNKVYLFFLFSLLNTTLLFSQSPGITPTSKLVFISDTQAPMWIEKFILKSNRNEQATNVLLNDLLSQNPDEIYFLGDVVNISCKKNHWNIIDSFLSKYHSLGFPTHSCLGNHELLKRKKKGEKNFQSRFPDHINTGFTITKDSVATVFLNSNFFKMNKSQILKQDEWYKAELLKLDSMPGIKCIIVGCHHSPYSDSKIVGSSVPVQEKFVPAFLATRKCKLFISGHAHLFQHFKVSGKDFLVIGGGGGLNHPLKKKSCGQKDLASDYKPMFHYLTVKRYADHFEIISRKIKNDFSGVEDGLIFDIDF